MTAGARVMWTFVTTALAVVLLMVLVLAVVLPLQWLSRESPR